MPGSPLIVISAPSGGGKSTVIQAVRKTYPDICYSISATTRPMRTGEREGVDYFFWTKWQFQNAIENDAFIEWAEVHNQYYGTLWSEIERAGRINQPLVLDLDVQGGLALKQKRPDAHLIFLMPPSIAVLEKRLRSRGTECEENLRTRMTNAKKEIQYADQYDYQVINEALQTTIHTVLSIIHKIVLK